MDTAMTINHRISFERNRFDHKFSPRFEKRAFVSHENSQNFASCNSRNEKNLLSNDNIIKNNKCVLYR